MEATFDAGFLKSEHAANVHRVVKPRESNHKPVQSCHLMGIAVLQNTVKSYGQKMLLILFGWNLLNC